RSANGFKRFPAHYHDLACGHLFEPLEIFRQMPRDPRTIAYHAIQRHGCDRFEGLHKHEGAFQTESQERNLKFTAELCEVLSCRQATSTLEMSLSLPVRSQSNPKGIVSFSPGLRGTSYPG